MRRAAFAVAWFLAMVMSTIMAANAFLLRPASVVAPSGQVPSSIAIGGDGCSSAACSVPNIDDASQFSATTASGLPPSGTYIGTLSTALSSGTPPFSGSYSLVSHTTGDNCGTGTINNTPFQIASTDQLQYNSGATRGTTYNVCAKATVGSNSTTAEFTITVGNIENASTVSGCTGSGTSASPWQAVCIQDGINAASADDTVFLPAGYWELNSAGAAAVPTSLSGITLIGASSGNTFDVTGHPNNASGTDLCGNTGITCIYTAGTSTTGGYLRYSPTGGGATCANDTFAHILIDGSQGYSGGDGSATFNASNCSGPFVFSDIRAMAAPAGDTETQFFLNTVGDVPNNAGSCPTNSIGYPMCILIKNSIFALPSAGGYGNQQALEDTATYGETLQNDYFWQGVYNPTYTEYSYVYGIITNDTQAGFDPAWGETGCDLSPGDFGPDTCASNGGGTEGSNHVTYLDTYNEGGTNSMALGIGVNGGGYNGNVNDVNISGNWVTGSTADIDTCVWYIYADQDNCNGAGNSINMSVNTSCASPARLDTYSISITNNSIIGTAAADLNAYPTGDTYCYESGGTQVAIPIYIYGYSASANYLSSPSNQYTTNSNTVSPSQSGNYCSTAAGTVTGCATTGFTNNPTAAFTLGSLYEYSGTYIIPFATTSFTAQYGAVEWLASTSSATPTSSGQSGATCPSGATVTLGCWAYVPPAWLSSVTHGNTVYLWVMDSVGHISAATPVQIP